MAELAVTRATLWSAALSPAAVGVGLMQVVNGEATLWTWLLLAFQSLWTPYVWRRVYRAAIPPKETPVPKTMNLANVPQDLADVATSRLRKWRATAFDNNGLARYILAAVLPLHAQQLGAELGRLTMPCPNHPTPNLFNYECAYCQRYTALVEARRVIEGRNGNIQTVHERHGADSPTPAFLITTDDILSKAHAEQLRADLQITARPAGPEETTP